MKKKEPSQTKRDEMSTYKTLALGRDFKSKVRREKSSARGVFRIIGGDDPSRPHLKVLSERYREVRAEVAKEVLQQAKAGRARVKIEAFLEQARSGIEVRTYQRLAAEQEWEIRLETVTVQGRQLTKQERERMKEAGGLATGMKPAFAGYRGELLDEVIGKVARRQRHNPARYQAVWAEAVGVEAAQQTWVERVDEKEGILYFRQANSALSYSLQRQADLPKKLTKALGMVVRKVVASR
jgi:hypothetical protein